MTRDIVGCATLVGYDYRLHSAGSHRSLRIVTMAITFRGALYISLDILIVESLIGNLLAVITLY